MYERIKRYFLLEVAGIAICFLVGIWSDWNVLVRRNALIIIEDIESFSLTILQIQATVGTLIIAIIALITGNISDSHMGVSVSDFYLNIRPWKLKQKILIFLSLGLCLTGVICHSLKLYNVVFYLFVATLIVVSISVIEIYSAINGLPIDFEKDELREFLHNNRKVINITAKISIQINEMPCGTIFTGRSRI